MYGRSKTSSQNGHWTNGDKGRVKLFEAIEIYRKRSSSDYSCKDNFKQWVNTIV